MSKRNWFLAVCDMSGTFEGNPASFEAATIYGPYTKEQVEEAEKIGEDFPHATYALTVFTADERPRFKSLLKLLKEVVAKAKQEEP
jgi:hypothetical protein